MKMMKPLMCLSLFFLPLLATISVVESGRIGGWNPIDDIADPYVVEIAKFAISEHNKLTKQNIVYDIVGGGRQQVVAGMRYNLTIYGNDGGEVKQYEAVVVDTPWEHVRTLESFKMV